MNMNMNSKKTTSKYSSQNIYQHMKQNINNDNVAIEIIKGYNGIMDLDLTYIPEELKKTMIEQHYKDIHNYNTEQGLLKPTLRYENTVERIRITHEKSQALILKRLQEQEEKKLHYIQQRNISLLKIKNKK